MLIVFLTHPHLFRVLNFFFFSSRRRHTSWPRDWSSDVCSSDLAIPGLGETAAVSIVEQRKGKEYLSIEEFSADCPKVKIGRASCREREKNAAMHETFV